MTRQRLVLYGLLAVVAAAAAVLSFAALRDLALICSFDAQLAWLLPIVVDAGAAAGSLAWLGSAAPAARGYGRVLALGMLVLSVAGNALAHGLAAYGARPHWLVVVAVSAIAPATVFAMVHLLVLVGRVAEPQTADVGEVGGEPGGLLDRRSVVDTARDGAIIDDLRALETAHGRRWVRDEVKAMYGIGSHRAGRLLSLIGWATRADDRAEADA